MMEKIQLLFCKIYVALFLVGFVFSVGSDPKTALISLLVSFLMMQYVYITNVKNCLFKIINEIDKENVGEDHDEIL